MKTIEQKAKAYDEALERAREYWETDNDNTLDIKAKGTMEYLFPELAESEGEKIRQYLIKCFTGTEDCAPNIKGKDILAWLEKQGEPLNESVFDRGNEMYQAISAGLCDVVGEFGWSDFGGIPIEEIQDWLEKQGKQNHFEQDLEMVVKPKFNIGDWIVSDEPHINNDYRLCKVVGISYGCYTIQTIDGLKGYNTFKEWESDYHLWSIEDAKPGDVLVAQECYVIFKEIDGLNIKCYCTYHYMGFNPSFHINTLQNKTVFQPATKEQRDILFQKMKEAGYEWDAENKELKKIDNEEINGEDYGIDGLWNAQRILEKTLGEVDGYQTDDGILDHKSAITAVKKLYEQKPAWTESDDEEFEIAINTLKDAGQYDSAAWLLTIKKRIGG